MWMAGAVWRLLRPDGHQSCAAAGRRCERGGSSRWLLRRLCIRALQLWVMAVLGCIPAVRGGVAQAHWALWMAAATQGCTLRGSDSALVSGLHEW
jgi:hypothetical protein